MQKMSFADPTLVQSNFIPLALGGKDVLVRARTGSGKTLAYVIPVLEKVLRAKRASMLAGSTEPERRVRAVVMVPSKELVAQTRAAFTAASFYCSDLITTIGLGDQTMGVQRMYLMERPDVIVCTPGKLMAHLEAGHVELKESVETLVLDEADLILSYGGNSDVRNVAARLPKVCQTFLMSATLSPELASLKQVILHKPAILKLEEGETDGQLAQFFVGIGPDDKELLLYALLKLKLVTGKIIFFVNDVDRCYRLKLLLEQFAVKSAVLNAELPANSRAHIVSEFNRGMFDHLIATDESLDDPEAEASDSDSDSEEEDIGGECKDDVPGDELKMAREQGRKRGADARTVIDEAVEAAERAEKSSAPEADAEFSAARGIDFKGVTAVVNYDFPLTAASYTHRIGRTARGGASGTALSLVEEGDAAASALLAEIQRSQPQRDGQPQPQRLPLDVTELESMRYRVADVRRAVTRVAVREARLKELKQELINSDKLQAHFEDNPAELAALQHDAFVRPERVRSHMASVPDYLLPAPLRGRGHGASGAAKKKQTRAARAAAARARYEEKRKRGGDPLQGFAVSAEQLQDAQKRTRPKKRRRAKQGQDMNAPRPVHDAGVSTSGRKKWKQRHQKGKFSKGWTKKKKKGSGQGHHR
jgi:ATP-dependent RNA helicase DDX56/DBP9